MINELSRRDFAIGLAAVASALPTVVATSGASYSAEPNKPNQDERPDPVHAEMTLWLELIRTRYPSGRLTPEVMGLIAGDVLGDIMHCRKISAVALQNWQAPAFVFEARQSAK